MCKFLLQNKPGILGSLLVDATQCILAVHLLVSRSSQFVSRVGGLSPTMHDVHLYIYICIYIYTYIYTHIYALIRIYISIHCIFVNTYTYRDKYMNTREDSSTYLPFCLVTLSLNIYVYIYIYICTYIYVHTQGHTDARREGGWSHAFILSLNTLPLNIFVYVYTYIQGHIHSRRGKMGTHIFTTL